MNIHQDGQPIGQLEKRKGGYYHLVIGADLVNQLDRRKATRLLCTLDQTVSFSCGLNHLGDGNFFIIVSTANLKALGKKPGDVVSVDIVEDPNPLGIDIPEVLQVLLDQDSDLDGVFGQLSDGKKRQLIFSIKPVKDIDKQVQKILAFFNEQKVKSRGRR